MGCVVRVILLSAASRILMVALTVFDNPMQRIRTHRLIRKRRGFDVSLVTQVYTVRVSGITLEFSLQRKAFPELMIDLLVRISVISAWGEAEVCLVQVVGRLAAGLVDGRVDVRLRYPGAVAETVIRPGEGDIERIMAIICPGLPRFQGSEMRTT